MPVYMYVARDAAGNQVQGHQEAASETAVVSILQNKGLYVTHVVNTAAVVRSAKSKHKRKRHKRISAQDLHFFIDQTANLLSVGIPFVRCMDVILELTESKQMYDVILQINQNIKSGSTFKDALARHPKVFPAYWTFLIEAGELSGTLPKVMSQLAKNIEATENLKKKVVSALVYPSVLVSVAILAIVFFVIVIIPIFAKLFRDFNAELPFLTKVIITISDFLRKNLLLFILGVGGAVYYIRHLMKSNKGRRAVQALLLNLPIAGGAVNDIIHARICIILSMLIRSGLSFLKSLEITGNVSGNYIYETAMSNIRLEVQQGKTLSASLAEHEIFNPMFVNLVKIGEESGKLPEMIEKSADFFASRVDLFATRIGVLIEPLILIFVGGIIGVIGVSIFMPIIKLSSAVG